MACRTEESGLGARPIHLRGEALVIEMDWLDAPVATADGLEEMVAVLEGQAMLDCGEERYRLPKGMGVLIPPGAPRRWSPVGGRALLYRVWTAR